MFKAGNIEITMQDFTERYRSCRGEQAALTDEGCSLAWRYFSQLNISFPSEKTLEQFLTGGDERFLSLEDKFREAPPELYFRMVTGEEDPVEALLAHYFWENLEKEPDTGAINFNDEDLSEEEFQKNQEEVEKYRQNHRFRFEKLEETVRSRFNEMTLREQTGIAWRMEQKYRLPKDGDIQSVILKNGNVLYVFGCTSDPGRVRLADLLEKE